MMSFEKITKPIQPKSVESHEKELGDKLLSVQFEYASKLLENKIPFPKGGDTPETFEGILKAYTDISGMVHDAYMQHTGKVPTGDDTDLINISRKIYNDVHEAFSSSKETWIAEIPRIIDKTVETLPKGTLLQSEEREKSPRAGLIRFDIRSGGEQLTEYGVTENDEYALLHLDPIYKQKTDKEKEFTNIFSSDSLKKLAQEIKAKYPNVKGVVAASWLIDSPIGKRIGFRPIPSQFEHFYHGEAFWGQFYNQSGQIDKERVQKFLETGKAFEVKGGFIPVDEFLEKYLPKES